MRRFLGIILPLVMIAACASISYAGVVYSSQHECSSDWNGIGAGYTPSWIGQTTVVEYRPKTQKELDGIFSTSSGTMCGTMGLDSMAFYCGSSYETRWTVNKISSWASASVKASTDYLVGGKRYEASSANSRSNSDSNYADLAHYGQIITYDNRLLADASAIATQTAALSERFFTASGCVSAASFLKNGGASASSKAEGNSCFNTSYSVEKETPFSFTLDLGNLADVDLTFSAKDDLTGETLWDLSPSRSGELRHLEWSGILDPGRYSFALNASVESSINLDGIQQNGGEAIYDVSFDFDAESYIVPLFQDVIRKWIPSSSDSGGLISLESPKNFFVITGSNDGFAETPEPSMLVLLFIAALSGIGYCRRRK